MRLNDVSEDWIVKALTDGRFAEKLVAQRLLEDPSVTFDRHAVRRELLRLLKDGYSPQREILDADPSLSDVRCWLLTSLGRLPGDGNEPHEALCAHLNPKNEPNPWARYWALTAVVRLNPADLPAICKPVATEDTELLPRMLAAAALTREGDTSQREVIMEALRYPPTDPKCPHPQVLCILRALRVVYLPFTIQYVLYYVQNPQYSDSTYEAIGALGNIPANSPHAEKAALTLMTFITLYRKYTFWDAMRLRAIGSIGKLKIESTAPLLLEELSDFNPSVASEAALALEAVLGPATTVNRVLEVLVKQGDQNLSRFARGLREMRDQKAVIEELGGALLYAGNSRDQAQRLLSEIWRRFRLRKTAQFDQVNRTLPVHTGPGG